MRQFSKYVVFAKDAEQNFPHDTRKGGVINESHQAKDLSLFEEKTSLETGCYGAPCLQNVAVDTQYLNSFWWVSTPEMNA